MNEDDFFDNTKEAVDSEFNSNNDNKSKLTVLPFKQKEVEAKGYLKLHGSDGSFLIIQADSFGPYEPFPGFIIFFRDDPEEVAGIYNSSFIKQIEILKDYSEQ